MNNVSYEVFSERVFVQDDVAFLQKEKEENTISIISCIDLPLDKAAKNKSYNVIAYILNNYQVNDFDIRAAIFTLINKANSLKTIKMLLEQPNCNIEDYSPYVLKAVKYNKLSILKHFLSLKDFSSNIKNGQILECVFSKKHKSCLKEILKEPIYSSDENVLIKGVLVAIEHINIEYISLFIKYFPHINLSEEKILKNSLPYRKDSILKGFKYYKKLNLKNQIEAF